MRYFYFTLFILFGVGQILAQPQLQLETFAMGFSSPVAIANAGDDRLFVVERQGFIRVVNADGSVENTVFLDIDNRVSDTGGEQGLLGLAFHPNFAENGYFFVNYSDNDARTFVSRFEVTADNPNVADPDSEVVILIQTQPFGNHNGGHLAFGPDGYLYIGLGDGGSGGDPGNRAQNPGTLLGKMLRIDIDNVDPDLDGNYAIPADNPFIDNPLIRSEIWSIGLRNPWRYSFDRLNGDLWVADVGQDAFEEINLERAGTDGGANYGWRCYEGYAVYDSNCTLDPDSLLFPVYAYPHAGSSNCSVTGGYVYRGSQYPGMYGYYIYADICSDRIFALRQNIDGDWINTTLLDENGISFSTFGEDQNGELYVAGLSNGRIYQLTDACGSFDLVLDATDESCPDSLDGSITAMLSEGDGPFSYQWSTGATAPSIADLPAGVYALTVTDANACEIIRDVTLTNNAPTPPVILTTMDSLEIADDYVSYLWYRNDTPLGGSDKPSLIPFDGGAYSVEVTNAAGCSEIFFIADVVLINDTEALQIDHFRLSPNPTPGLLHMSGISTESRAFTVQVFTQLGQVVWQKDLEWAGPFNTSLPLSHLGTGAYYLRISQDGRAFTRAFQIQ